MTRGGGMAGAGSGDGDGVDALDDWMAFMAAAATRNRRARSGITGFVAKNAGRVRTVRRIVRDLGLRDAAVLILRELRR